MEDSAKRRTQIRLPVRGWAVRCSQLRMLPMHAWGTGQRTTKGGIELATKQITSNGVWHHAIENYRALVAVRCKIDHCPIETVKTFSK
jgi:transposase